MSNEWFEKLMHDWPRRGAHSCLLLCFGFPLNFIDRLQAKNPSLPLRHDALGWRQNWPEERRQSAFNVGAGKPGGDAEGVVLVPGAALIGETARSERGVDLGDS